jgi:predicted amidohydrolase YtcJ
MNRISSGITSMPARNPLLFIHPIIRLVPATLFLFSFLFGSCSAKHKIKADLIVHHGVIYTVDAKFSTAESFAVKDGIVIAIGKNDSILDNYESKEMLDAAGKAVFPGFIDSHCHFYGYGRSLEEVDLTGTKSFDEILKRLRDFVKQRPDMLSDKNGRSNWIIGHGWDQNNWSLKEFPERSRLDSLFPEIPVFLSRIDGHAALVNAAALKQAGITECRNVEGGLIGTRSWHDKVPAKMDISGPLPFQYLSGLLVDNAMNLVNKVMVHPSKADIIRALLDAQRNCFAKGLTTVDDAGLEKELVDVIDQIQKSGELKMKVYAMLSPTKENLDYYLAHGQYKTDRLNIRSFKFYADGALGSRGACLLKPYTDKPHEQGFLLNPPEYYRTMALEMFRKGFQMNTHCIGDSAVRMMLHLYENIFQDYVKKGGHLRMNPRWRIEHFQVTTPEDIALLRGHDNKLISPIPSVQPTHATSDMPWAGERLGPERIKYAYAYNDLKDAAGIVALGTDFPVEDISPIKTFYAAVTRMDATGFPKTGFQPENRLSREDAIRGMTIWGAYANFEEKEKGSLEPGKAADFILLDNDLMKCAYGSILSTSTLATYINGERVFYR